MSCHTKKGYNTHWVVEYVDPNDRFEANGSRVPANAPILLKHCASNQYLGSDTKVIKTE